MRLYLDCDFLAGKLQIESKLIVLTLEIFQPGIGVCVDFKHIRYLKLPIKD